MLGAKTERFQQEEASVQFKAEASVSVVARHEEICAETDVCKPQKSKFCKKKSLGLLHKDHDYVLREQNRAGSFTSTVNEPLRELTV